MAKPVFIWSQEQDELTNKIAKYIMEEISQMPDQWGFLVFLAKEGKTHYTHATNLKDNSIEAILKTQLLAMTSGEKETMQ